MRSRESSFLISNSREVIDDLSTTVGERLESCSLDLKKMYETEVRDETRISAIDEKLTKMMKMLANLDQSRGANNTQQHIQSESSRFPPQVRTSDWEQNRNDSSLGYRYDALTVANCEKMPQEIIMPVFDGSEPSVWIVNVETFFRIGKHNDEDKLDLVALSLTGRVQKWFAWEFNRDGFTDWNDFKTRLLAQFDSTQNYYPSESRLRKDSIPKESTPTMVTEADSTSDTESILELGNKKTEIFPELVRPHFTELPHSREAGSCCDSPPEVLPKHESLHESVKKQASLSQSSSILQLQQIEQTVIGDSFDAYRFGGKETVQVVKQLESSNEDNIFVDTDEKMSYVQQPCSFTNLVLSKERDPMLYMTMHMRYGRVIRQLQISKVMCKMRLRQKLQELNQFTIGAGKFQVKHKWRFKQLKPVSTLAFGLDQVDDENCSKVFVNTRLLSQVDHIHVPWFLALRRVTWLGFCLEDTLVTLLNVQTFMDVCFKTEFLARGDTRCMLFHHFSREAKVQITNNLLQSERKVGVDIVKGEVFNGETTKPAKSCGKKFHELKQFRISDAKFHLKHKWRSKTLNLLNITEQMTTRVDQVHLLLLQKRSKMNWPWFCPSETLDQSQVLSLYAILIFQSVFAIKVEGERTELLPYGSFHRSSPISFYSPSLRSSLFSRKGVYKRVCTCWLIVEMLVWLISTSNESDFFVKGDRKQRDKEEVTTHWLLPVLKERSSLIEI